MHRRSSLRAPLRATQDAHASCQTGAFRCAHGPRPVAVCDPPRPIDPPPPNRYEHLSRLAGEVSERLKELVSKTSVRATVPGVRIPPSPIANPVKTASLAWLTGFLHCVTSLALCVRPSTGAYLRPCELSLWRQAGRQDIFGGFGVVGPGRLRYFPRPGGQVGECRQGFALLALHGVGVSVHRQRDRRVTGQRLRRTGMHATGRQIRDEGVAQGVKIRHAPAVVPVPDARSVQILAEHRRRARWKA